MAHGSVEALLPPPSVENELRQMFPLIFKTPIDEKKIPRRSFFFFKTEIARFWRITKKKIFNINLTTAV